MSTVVKREVTSASVGCGLSEELRGQAKETFLPPFVLSSIEKMSSINKKEGIMTDLRNQTESYWKERLTPEQYQVCRLKGTERAFSGALYRNHADGTYACVACGQSLFSSDAKFESGSGWPSFDDPINREHIELQSDHSHFMQRTEVLCKNCGAHLGHVFDDGPRETTGKRYCINSVALQFQPKEESHS